MTENNIFPEDILNNTVEYHIAKHSRKSNLIFWLIFLAIAAILIALPFIYVDVYSTSRGLIISEENPVTLYAPTSGRVTYYNLKENEYVSKGDTLLIVNQKILDEKRDLIDIQAEDAQEFINDLGFMLDKKFSKIKTKQFKKEYIQHSQEIFNINTLIKNSKTQFERADLLFKKNVIARTEFEKALLDLNKLKNDKINIIKQAQLRWQKQLTEYEEKLDNLNSNKIQLLEEKNTYVLTSPIDGELINVQGFNKGSIVNPSNNIANISPVKNLIIESYVSPSDIGHIKEGIDAKYQIDSYNSNQWGFATGEIIEVGKDIITLNDAAIFKVRSSLNESKLSLKNGAEGNLKKGMTVTSRFFLTRRSLFQLLFDSIDDWFNPYNNKNE
ncbi:HlyD family secretion protein [Corallibacter sp.]|uniref:HlyD family secretion protein n=1 Tax=Corallibacter sp. TaxID=2038084 RepID=UPI003AB2E912